MTEFADVTERDRADVERWQHIITDLSNTKRVFEDAARDKRVIIGWRQNSDNPPSIQELRENVNNTVTAIRRAAPADVDVQGTVLADTAPGIRIVMRWQGPQGGERNVITHVAVAPRCLLSVKIVGRDRSPADMALWTAVIAEVDRLRAIVATAAIHDMDTMTLSGATPGLDLDGDLKALYGHALKIFPLAGTAILGGLLYSFVWGDRLPKGNWLGRGYCLFMMLGTGGWIALVLLADSALKIQNPSLVTESLLAPALLFVVHLTALLKPRSWWFTLALSLVAGNLLTSAGLMAVGLAEGPTPGHIFGFVVSGALLGLVARKTLLKNSAKDQAAVVGSVTQC
ncbi:MAG: hypothetical protein WCF85_22210 [Rhodospirillaceae bacterium]